MTASGPLFGAAVPAGFQYQDNFITSDDEVRLADEIASIEFSTFEMRGVVARRRVAFFGRSYDAAAASTPPLPAFLMPLRDKVARWAHYDRGLDDFAARRSRQTAVVIFEPRPDQEMTSGS